MSLRICQTQCVGVWEHMNIGAFMVWVVVLANTLLCVDDVAAVTSVGKVRRRLARAATTSAAFSVFGAGAGQRPVLRFSGATLGPGAFMLSIPKILGGSLAPFLAVAGAVGAASACRRSG